MTKQPLPRFTATVSVSVEISAADYTQATERLADVEQFLRERLGRSTFRRLVGMPEVVFVESGDPN